MRLLHSGPTGNGNTAGALLWLRGGAGANMEALVSVTTNTLALTLFTAMRQWLHRHFKLTDAQDLLATALCGFLAYMTTFMLHGFVPMGFVPGAQPILPSVVS